MDVEEQAQQIGGETALLNQDILSLWNNEACTNSKMIEEERRKTKIEKKKKADQTVQFQPVLTDTLD